LKVRCSRDQHPQKASPQRAPGKALDSGLHRNDEQKNAGRNDAQRAFDAAMLERRVGMNAARAAPSFAIVAPLPLGSAA
jgi:hypothetical protein